MVQRLNQSFDVHRTAFKIVGKEDLRNTIVVFFVILLVSSLHPHFGFCERP
jgi:hypothetical protein